MNYELTELLPVVTWLTGRYTGKESTSVTYETANQLMEAVLYCIRELEGAQRTSAAGSGDGGGTDTTSLYDKRRRDARKDYDAGYEIAFQKVIKARKLYDAIMRQFHSYGNICCEETIRDGMPEFFLRYDVRFCPQDHILTLDYPVLIDLNRRSGIDRIYGYLSCVRLEQMFLNRFPEAFVREATAAQNPDYPSLIINMSSVVLRHVLGCMMIGKSVQESGFSRDGYERIRDIIIGMEPEELSRQLEQLLKALLEQGFSGKKQLYRYLSADIAGFRTALINAAEHDCLDAVL